MVKSSNSDDGPVCGTDFEMDVHGSTKPAVSTGVGGGVDCEENGTRLSALIKKNRSAGNFATMMEMFAHSSSCSKRNCTPLCLMFRRVRRHIVLTDHHCMIRRIYARLLKHHVRSCKNLDCANAACKSEKEKRLQDEQQQQQQMEVDEGTQQQSCNSNYTNTSNLYQ